jgi:predicted SAM-dependent methyltransferase
MLKVIKRKIIKLIAKSGYKTININPNSTKFVYEDKIDKEILYLNVGAGSWFHPYWTNLDNPRSDYAKSLYANLNYDLTSGDSWPIKDNSLNIVYSSHTIEHLNDKFTLDLMKQAYKKLKSGGIIRLTCPDIDVLLDAYKRKDEYVFKVCNTQKLNIPLKYSIHQSLLLYFAGECCNGIVSNKINITDEEIQKEFKSLTNKDFLNKYTNMVTNKFVKDYPKEHKTWFNAEKLLEMLKLAGFEEVYKSAYMQSRSPILRNPNFFDNTHPDISVYVEAVK